MTPFPKKRCPVCQAYFQVGDPVHEVDGRLQHDDGTPSCIPTDDPQLVSVVAAMVKTREWSAGMAFGVPEDARTEFTQALARAAIVALRVGNDGLTDAERAESAERWRQGAGRAPTRAEFERWRATTPLFVQPDDGSEDGR